jgi:two-component system, OmpR family, sensor histidine kinase KdpD
MVGRVGDRPKAQVRSVAAPEGAARGPLNLSSVLLVSAVAVLGVVEARMLGLGTLPALLVATVLLAATMFGAFPGLFVLGLVAVTLRAGGIETAPSEAAYRLLVVGAATVACGGYTDFVRRQMRQTLTLRQAAAPLGAHASTFEMEAARGPESSTPREEAQRGLASLCMVGTSAAITLLLGDLLGPASSSLVVIASSGLAGALLGSRFGLFAGLTAWVVTVRLTSQQDLFQTALGLAVTGAIGWGAGLLTERRRQAERALDTLIVAGRELSAVTHEADIRRGLVESLAKLSPRSRVHLSDGQAPDISHHPSGAAGWSPSDPRWRTRTLAAADREVGVARWWFPGSGRRVEGLDAVAVSLVDLAASAIVRERVNVEKGDIELIARTEHLRTILLDAVAHHFRSPLAGILGSATSILNLPPNHDRAVQRELLFIIKDQANRLSRYVDNFLSVARLESGDVDVAPADVNLEALVYDVWETFGEIGGARRFLSADIALSTIRTDPKLLGQALGNVLENAIKYTPEESTVDVRAYEQDGAAIIEIRDEGAGVPVERMTRIFERFYRSRSEGTPGLGLGLYITKSIAEILGGRVEARNRTSRSGLLVTLALPQKEHMP